MASGGDIDVSEPLSLMEREGLETGNTSFEGNAVVPEGGSFLEPLSIAKLLGEETCRKKIEQVPCPAEKKEKQIQKDEGYDVTKENEAVDEAKPTAEKDKQVDDVTGSTLLMDKLAEPCLDNILEEEEMLKHVEAIEVEGKPKSLEKLEKNEEEERKVKESEVSSLERSLSQEKDAQSQAPDVTVNSLDNPETVEQVCRENECKDSGTGDKIDEQQIGEERLEGGEDKSERSSRFLDEIKAIEKIKNEKEGTACDSIGGETSIVEAGIDIRSDKEAISESMEDKQNTDDIEAQTEEMYSRQVDKSEICSVSERESEESVKKSPEEESQTVILEKTAEAGSSGGGNIKDEQKLDDAVFVKNEEESKQNMHQDLAMAEESTDESRVMESPAVIAAENIISSDAVVPITFTAAQDHSAIEDEEKLTDALTNVAPEHSKEETSTHEDKMEEIFAHKDEAEIERIENSMTQISGEIDTATSSECSEANASAKEDTTIRIPGESFEDKKEEKPIDTDAIIDNGIPVEKGLPPMDLNEKIEDEELEFQNKNSSELHVSHSLEQETTPAKGEKESNVSDFEPQEQAHEANGPSKDLEKHVEDASESRKNTNLEHPSAEGAITTEVSSKASQMDAEEVKKVPELEPHKKLEIDDPGKKLEEEMQKKEEAHDEQTYQMATTNDTIEEVTSDKVCRGEFVDKKVEHSVQEADLQEAETPLRNEVEQDNEMSNIINEEVIDEPKITDIGVVIQEQKIKDDVTHLSSKLVIDKKMVESSQDNEMEAEMSKEEYVEEKMMVDDNTKVILQESIQEASVKNFQNDGNNAEKSSREIYEVSEVEKKFETNNNIDESPDSTLQTSLLKEQDSLQTENLTTAEEGKDEDEHSTRKGEKEENNSWLKEVKEYSEQETLKGEEGGEQMSPKNEARENLEHSASMISAETEEGALNKLTQNTEEEIVEGVEEVTKEEETGKEDGEEKFIDESNSKIISVESIKEVPVSNLPNDEKNAEEFKGEISDGTNESIPDATYQNDRTPNTALQTSMVKEVEIVQGEGKDTTPVEASPEKEEDHDQARGLSRFEDNSIEIRLKEDLLKSEEETSKTIDAVAHETNQYTEFPNSTHETSPVEEQASRERDNLTPAETSVDEKKYVDGSSNKKDEDHEKNTGLAEETRNTWETLKAEENLEQNLQNNELIENPETGADAFSKMVDNHEEEIVKFSRGNADAEFLKEEDDERHDIEESNVNSLSQESAEGGPMKNFQNAAKNSEKSIEEVSLTLETMFGEGNDSNPDLIVDNQDSVRETSKVEEELRKIEPEESSSTVMAAETEAGTLTEKFDDITSQEEVVTVQNIEQTVEKEKKEGSEVAERVVTEEGLKVVTEAASEENKSVENDHVEEKNIISGGKVVERVQQTFGFDSVEKLEVEEEREKIKNDDMEKVYGDTKLVSLSVDTEKQVTTEEHTSTDISPQTTGETTRVEGKTETEKEMEESVITSVNEDAEKKVPVEESAINGQSSKGDETGMSVEQENFEAAESGKKLEDVSETETRDISSELIPEKDPGKGENMIEIQKESVEYVGRSAQESQQVRAEAEEKTKLKFEAEGDVKETQNTDETVKDIIFTEEVHEEVKRADSETPKCTEKVVNDTREFYAKSTEDERVHEVNKSSLVAGEYHKATESKEQTAVVSSDFQEAPATAEEMSVAKAMEDEDNKMPAVISTTTPNEESEEMIKTTEEEDSCSDKIMETTTVEITKTSLEEAQLVQASNITSNDGISHTIEAEACQQEKITSQIPPDDYENIMMEQVAKGNADADDVQENKRPSDVVYESKDHGIDELNTSTIKEENEKPSEIVEWKSKELAEDPGTTEEAALQKEDCRERDISHLELQSSKECGTPDETEDEIKEGPAELVSITDSQGFEALKEDDCTSGQTIMEEKLEEQNQTLSVALLSKEKDCGTETTIEDTEKYVQEVEIPANPLNSSSPDTIEETCLRKEETNELEFSGFRVELNTGKQKDSLNEVQVEESKSLDDASKLETPEPETSKEAFESVSEVHGHKGFAASKETEIKEKHPEVTTADLVAEENQSYKIIDGAEIIHDQVITGGPFEITSNLRTEISGEAFKSISEVHGHAVLTEPEENEIKEKHLEVAVTDKVAEENESERTIDASEIIHDELTNEEIMEEQEDANNGDPVTLGEETTKESQEEYKLKGEESLGDMGTANDIQNEELKKEVEKKMGERIIEHLHLTAAENETTKESFLDEAGSKLHLENQSHEIASGNDGITEAAKGKEEELDVEKQKEGPTEIIEATQDIHEGDQETSKTATEHVKDVGMEVLGHKGFTASEETEIKEKNKEVAVTDMEIEENQSERTTDATGIIHDELTNEEIMKEKEDVNNVVPATLGEETTKESQEELAEESVGDQGKAKVIQNEESYKEVEKADGNERIEKQMDTERINEHLHLAAVENETLNGAPLDEAKVKNVKEARSKLLLKNHSDETTYENDGKAEAATVKKEELDVEISKKEDPTDLVKANEATQDVHEKVEISKTTSEHVEEHVKEVEIEFDEHPPNSSATITKKEETKEQEICVLGVESNTDMQKNGSKEFGVEEGRTPDEDSTLQPQGYEKKKKDKEYPLENDKMTDITETGAVEKTSDLRTEISEEAFKSLSEVQEHELLTESEHTEMKKEKRTEGADLVTGENQNEKTIDATELVQDELTKEEVMEEKEDTNCIKKNLGEETTKEKHQIYDLKAEESREDEMAKEIQNEEVKNERISEYIHQTAFEKKTVEESFPDEPLVKNAEDMGTKLQVENQSDYKISGYDRTATIITNEEFGTEMSEKECLQAPAEADKTIQDTHQGERDSDSTSEKSISIEAKPEETREGKKDAPQVLLQELIVEAMQSAEVGETEPENAIGIVNSRGLEHGTEKSIDENGIKGIDETMSAKISLFDMMQRSTRESRVARDLTEEKEVNAGKEETRVEGEKTKSDEEKEDEEEGEEHKTTDSVSDAPVMVEASRDIVDVKVANKKSHNILSGVGSKVKHSISKVKKAITGKSSHPKQHSPK